MTLKSAHNKVLYLLAAASVAILLLTAPIIVPSAHADCSTASSSSCVG